MAPSRALVSPAEHPPLRLPYAPRPGQLELAEAARTAFREGRQAILEAGTGTGKTVAVLAAALDVAEKQDLKVVYLTRTNSQARQVMHEFRKLTEGRTDRPLALALQGRAHQCPELSRDPRFAGATAEEYARLCGALKRKTLRALGVGRWGIRPKLDPEEKPDDATSDEPAAVRPNPRSLPMAKGAGCNYYAGLLASDPEALAAELAAQPLDAEPLAARLAERGLCPYEAVKGILSSARLVVAPYIYLADPRLARALQDWLEAPLSKCIVVVDEAHNLPDYLRGLHSPELSTESLHRARIEAGDMGDPVVREGCTASEFVGIVEKALLDVAADRLLPGEEDALLPPEDLTVHLLSALRTTTFGVTEVLENLLTIGEKVRDAQQRAGRLPRSYLGSLGGFLSAWLHASPAEHVHVVVGGEDPRLVLFCLDPSIGARFLHEARAAVHLSGTLRPLDQYRDLLGLEQDTSTQSFPSPFPPEHLALVLVDDVTTRYEDRQREPEMMDRLHNHLESFGAERGVNAAVFFPSHALLGEARALGLGGPGRRVFVEAAGMAQAELMAALDLYRGEGRATKKGGAGALWLGVMGGRVAEGMDFPGETLEAACLVGVPYPRPDARQRALVRFNEIRFGRGWDYAVEGPTLRRVLQAVGRVIRDADDRGIVFLLDARYRRYADHLPRLSRLPDGVTVGQALREWLRERDAQPVALR